MSGSGGKKCHRIWGETTEELNHYKRRMHWHWLESWDAWQPDHQLNLMTELGGIGEIPNYQPFYSHESCNSRVSSRFQLLTQTAIHFFCHHKLQRKRISTRLVCQPLPPVSNSTPSILFLAPKIIPIRPIPIRHDTRRPRLPPQVWRFRCWSRGSDSRGGNVCGCPGVTPSTRPRGAYVGRPRPGSDHPGFKGKHGNMCRKPPCFLANLGVN